MCDTALELSPVTVRIFKRWKDAIREMAKEYETLRCNMCKKTLQRERSESRKESSEDGGRRVCIHPNFTEFIVLYVDKAHKKEIASLFTADKSSGPYKVIL